MKQLGRWMRAHPKVTTAAVGAAVAAGATYGVSPGAVHAMLSVLGALIGY